MQLDSTQVLKHKMYDFIQLAEAGFYFAPNATKQDNVKCYACGIEIDGWNTRTDDPWLETSIYFQIIPILFFTDVLKYILFVLILSSRTQHGKHNPNCLYHQKKKGYENELTIFEFVEIEMYRYMRMNVNIVFFCVENNRNL